MRAVGRPVVPLGGTVRRTFDASEISTCGRSSATLGADDGGVYHGNALARLTADGLR